MSEEPADPPSRGPIDATILDRIATRLRGSTRFERIERRPAHAPNAVIADYDRGYFPGGVDRAYLRVRWFETDDFSVHYAEQYRSGELWACRWDRHPNDHNTRGHFHPPPDAATPGSDETYPDDWRDVLATVLARLDERIDAFWAE